MRAEPGDTVLLIGTMKGAFLARAGRDRSDWVVDGPHFPGEEVYALALERIWQIRPGRPDDPDSLYLGVEPSCVFESRDGGDTWAPVPGFLNHEHRPYWTPGNGGLCLHTILPDPHPEFGQCVHKVAHSPKRPERLFLQNHWGLYRSDDWGEAWVNIANGVPSDFGFAMAAHPHDPDTVYIVPLESDGFRCTPEARMRVYRTRDAGASWHSLEQGLPQENAYETVLRDALDTDASEPAGVYFGTRSGKVYASGDDGDSWTLLRDGLPPVVCVKAATLA